MKCSNSSPFTTILFHYSFVFMGNNGFQSTTRSELSWPEDNAYKLHHPSSLLHANSLISSGLLAQNLLCFKRISSASQRQKKDPPEAWSSPSEELEGDLGIAGGSLQEQNITRINGVVSNKHHTRSAAHILSPGAPHGCILTPCHKKVWASTMIPMFRRDTGRCGWELRLIRGWPLHLSSISCSLVSCGALVWNWE